MCDPNNVKSEYIKNIVYLSGIYYENSIFSEIVYLSEYIMKIVYLSEYNMKIVYLVK